MSAIEPTPCQAVSAQRLEETWFAEPGSLGAEWAKRQCAGCPLLDMCRSRGVDEGIPFGVYGGLDANDRERVWQGMDERPLPFKGLLPDLLPEAELVG